MRHPEPEKLSAFLEDDLPRPEREEVAGHLETCVACQEKLAHLRRTLDSLATLPSYAPGEGFSQRVMERVYRRRNLIRQIVGWLTLEWLPTSGRVIGRAVGALLLAVVLLSVPLETLRQESCLRPVHKEFETDFVEASGSHEERLRRLSSGEDFCIVERTASRRISVEGGLNNKPKPQPEIWEEADRSVGLDGIPPGFSSSDVDEIRFYDALTSREDSSPEGTEPPRGTVISLGNEGGTQLDALGYISIEASVGKRESEEFSDRSEPVTAANEEGRNEVPSILFGESYTLEIQSERLGTLAGRQKPALLPPSSQEPATEEMPSSLSARKDTWEVIEEPTFTIRSSDVETRVLAIQRIAQTRGWKDLSEQPDIRGDLAVPGARVLRYRIHQSERYQVTDLLKAAFTSINEEIVDSIADSGDSYKERSWMDGNGRIVLHGYFTGIGSPENMDFYYSPQMRDGTYSDEDEEDEIVIVLLVVPESR